MVDYNTDREKVSPCERNCSKTSQVYRDVTYFVDLEYIAGKDYISVLKVVTNDTSLLTLLPAPSKKGKALYTSHGGTNERLMQCQDYLDPSMLLVPLGYNVVDSWFGDDISHPTTKDTVKAGGRRWEKSVREFYCDACNLEGYVFSTYVDVSTNPFYADRLIVEMLDNYTGMGN